MNIFKKSLGAKILGLVFVVLVVFFVSLFFVSTSMQREMVLDNIKLSAIRISETLEGAIRRPMEIGDNAGTTDEFKNMGMKYPDIKSYLINYKNNITYSTDSSVVRKDFEEAIQNEDLKVLVQSRLKSSGHGNLLTSINDKDHFIEVKTISNERSCYHCHGSSQPVLGALIFVQDVSGNMNELTALQVKNGVIMGGGCFVLLAVLWIVLRVAVLKPVKEVVVATSKISNGDLTVNVRVRDEDEISQVCSSLNLMVESMKKTLRGVANGVQELVESSSGLQSVSNDVCLAAQNNQSQAEDVSKNVQAMSGNMNSVAAATEQATVNISTVAAATEEMSVTINEIAQNAGRAKNITASAVETAKEATNEVDHLGSVAVEIQDVTKTISNISSQTHILALNAVIEATRAGDAGKGFSVVANEIKALAVQTATAAKEIQDKIVNVQNATGQTINRIQEVSRIIFEIDSIVATMAVAVEEQSVTTRDIAENVGQAAQGVEEISRNIAQTSSGANRVADEITKVEVSAKAMSRSGGEIEELASGLATLSGQLKTMIEQFKTE